MGRCSVQRLLRGNGEPSLRLDTRAFAPTTKRKRWSRYVNLQVKRILKHSWTLMKHAVDALRWRSRVPSRDPRDKPTPSFCPKCASPLAVFLPMHYLMDAGSTEWALWGSCPVCQQFYVKHIPPRSVEECGWHVDRNPPEFVRRRGHPYKNSTPFSQPPYSESGLYDRELDS